MNKSKITTHSIAEDAREVLKTSVEAISLLKEIRIISGINERKYYKSSDVQVSNEFNYINHMIDKFKNKFELEGFKK